MAFGVLAVIVGAVVGGAMGSGSGFPTSPVAAGGPPQSGATVSAAGSTAGSFPGSTGTSPGSSTGGSLSAPGPGAGSFVGRDTSTADGASTGTGSSSAPTAALAPGLPGTATLTPALSRALTAQLGQLRLINGIPGIQATIIFPNGQSWRAHAGFRDFAARGPVANSTPFAVASVSKTFLAALVVELSQEGRFGLDDPVLRWLPDANVDPRVTIRELLNHTSGVYDFFSNAAIDKALLGCRSCAWSPSRSLSFVKKPYFAPGTNWAYSNTGYVLLGQLVEQVTGTSYATLLRQRFFDPLGLVSTYVQYLEPAPYPVAHAYQFFTYSRHETPTSLWDGTGISPFRSVLTAAGSAGSIASSSRDLAIWARALYSGRLFGFGDLAEMLDFAATRSFFVYDDPYGLGVQQYVVGGRIAYGHDGRLLGARSAIRYIPSLDVSIAVVMNTDRGDPGAIAEQLLALVAPPLPPLPSPSPSPLPSPSAGSSPGPGDGSPSP